MDSNTAAESRQPADASDFPGLATAVEEINDDALATVAETWANEADLLFRMARRARGELLRRLVDSGATVLDTPHWEGKVKPGLIHHAIDDVERFRARLAPLVDPAGLAKAFVQPPPPTGPPPIRADHNGLNGLAKLGGEVAAIIGEERRSQQGDPTLDLKRKPESASGEELANGEGPEGLATAL